MRITELDSGERPREKLIEKGPEALSDGELVAVLLREGHGQKNALDLSREILSMCGGSLEALFGMSAGKLQTVPGIGACKAATIQAALELGRRFLEAAFSEYPAPVVSARMIYDIMIPRMKGLLHEECWAIFLNSKNYVTSKMKVCEGNLNSTVIDSARILREALDRGASAVVLAHNHPSGNPAPSAADVKITKELSEALHTLGMSLLDHVVVSSRKFFSFADNRTYNGM